MKAARDARENDADAALQEAANRDVSLEGQIPMPSWATSDGPAKPAEEDSLDAERFPHRIDRAPGTS
jgi:hypothetical protein